MGKGSWPSWLAIGRRPSPLLNLQDFREHVAAAIARRHPSASIDQFGDDGLWVELGGEPAQTFSLARFHTLYCQQPRDLDRLVNQLGSFPARSRRVSTTDALRILVRPDTYLLEGDAAEDRQISRHLSGRLWAIVAVEESDAIGFPPGSVLREDLRMDDHAIWDRALRNTRREFPAVRVPPVGQLQFLAADNGFASSCLADEALWRRLDGEAEEGLLVLPLETKVVCVVGGRSPDVVPALRSAIAISEASADHLSSVVLTREGGFWLDASKIDQAFAIAPFKH